MPENALFYKNVVALQDKRHLNYSIELKGDYSFAQNTNAVYLSLVEFTKTSKEYPIVFAGKEDNLLPVALLGLEKDKNLFLNKYAHWNAEYIPAYVRRYPFILANNDKDFTVCIDESYEGINQAGRGEKLFDADGQQSAYLKRMVGFLKQYQSEHQSTLSFIRMLNEYDLLESMNANVELNSGVKVSLTGFKIVSRKRLKELDTDKLSHLMKTDVLEKIYTHLISLENFNQLMERFSKNDLAH